MAGPAILKIEILSDAKPATAELGATDQAARDAAKGVDKLGDSFDDTARRAKKLEDATDTIDDVGGASGKTATGLNDLAGAFELVGAEGFADRMGVVGTVMDAAAGAADLYVAATEFLSLANLKSIGTLIAKTAATVASTVAMTATTVATGVWTAAQWLLNAALDANPIGLVVLAILALIAVVILIIKHWGTIKDVTIDVWNAIKDAVIGAWNWIKANVFDKAAAVFEAYIALWGKLFDVIGDVWSKIKSTLADNPITRMIDAAIEKIKAIIDWFGKLKLPDWITNLNPFAASTDTARVFRLLRPPTDPDGRSAGMPRLSADAGVAAIVDRLIRPMTIVNVFLDGQKVRGLVQKVIDDRFDVEGAVLASGSWGEH